MSHVHVMYMCTLVTGPGSMDQVVNIGQITTCTKRLTEDCPKRQFWPADMGKRRAQLEASFKEFDLDGSGTLSPEGP
jgi:hypothetical protein